MNRSALCVRNRKGFTLIELICALAVSSVLLVVASAMFYQTAVVAKKVESSDTLFLHGSFTMDYIEREIRAAEAVYGPEEAGVAILHSEPVGFVLKMHDTRYITYGTESRNLYRYTAGEQIGFMRKEGITGKNQLAPDITRASAAVDAQRGLLTLEICMEGNGTRRDYSRLIEIPVTEE